MIGSRKSQNEAISCAGVLGYAGRGIRISRRHEIMKFLFNFRTFCLSCIDNTYRILFNTRSEVRGRPHYERAELWQL